LKSFNSILLSSFFIGKKKQLKKEATKTRNYMFAKKRTKINDI
jgi:hypothetical protein